MWAPHQMPVTASKAKVTFIKLLAAGGLFFLTVNTNDIQADMTANFHTANSKQLTRMKQDHFLCGID